MPVITQMTKAKRRSGIFLICIHLQFCFWLSLSFSRNDVIGNHRPSQHVKLLRDRFFRDYTSELYGGYDATIGADPNTPIQVYCSIDKTEAELGTQICLAELDLKFEMMEITSPKPDWFTRIHPSGITPAVRNPADSDDFIYNASAETDDVNLYLCKLHSVVTGSSCPLLPAEDTLITTIKELEIGWLTSVMHKLISYSENALSDNEDILKQEMEDQLLAYFEGANAESQLSGHHFNLLDIRLISTLGPALANLKASKGYELPKSDTVSSIRLWLEFCKSRPTIQEVMGDILMKI